MKFTQRVKEIPETITETGQKISNGIDVATIYLVIVGTVAVTALIVATVALGKSRA